MIKIAITVSIIIIIIIIIIKISEYFNKIKYPPVYKNTVVNGVLKK